ncbi:UDP-3-O-(3-hydroxymyristoyl)glucosamine N-acyltransferase [bacterium]|nr:UDP-3-O-(3-hydroxymyristoyl)glucosamine N-acyltransferase [bacterium]
MKTLEQLAALTGGKVKGDGALSLAGFCSLDNPRTGCISYMEKLKDASSLADTSIAALITTESLAGHFTNVLIHPNPRLAFISVMEDFIGPSPEAEGFIHPRAVVEEGAEVHPTARISACAVVSPGARIGARTFLGAGVYVGRDAVLGEDCFIHANVSIYSRSQIGNRVEIHAGTTIGSAGFGYLPTSEGHRRFPQVGDVIIEDDVDVGANCCIDRAALDSTVIHSGTKIDNLVQIAHGVSVGTNTVIAAQTGISGGTSIGKWCVIGGQAGFQGHITVGDQSIVAAQSGVFNSLEYKSKVSGYPAKPHGQSLKVLALTFKLPQLVEKVKSMEIDIDLLSGELKSLRKRGLAGTPESIPAGSGELGELVQGLAEKFHGLEMDIELIRSELHSLRSDGGDPPTTGSA